MEKTRAPAATNAALWHIVTAEIFYYLPDYPLLLQSLIWQELDCVPGLPGLRRFLDFWQKEIEGALHSVVVSSRGVFDATELKLFGAEFKVH